MMGPKVRIVGAGLAGSEAAYYLLKKGYEVFLFERRPLYDDKAHETDLFGELVCSNSLKSKRLDNACGLLKEEIRALGSVMMEASAASAVPSGNALAVDRLLFARFVTDRLRSFPNFHEVRETVDGVPNDDIPTIIATGPLTDGSLLEWLQKEIGAKGLAFFDASAPIIKKESIDFSIAYYKSRFEQGDDAYINCPFTKEEYGVFVDALVSAEKAETHSFDAGYFEGCMPIEVMASRGWETLRHGPLKPFGLSRGEGDRPFAVAQLRQDTLLGDLYNLVGFQTNLTYPEQRRVFRLIPGLQNAEFARYGLMHRNVYLSSPFALNEDLSLKKRDNVYIAGQLTGVEGYVESAAMGLLSALYLDRRLKGESFEPVPRDTVLGALTNYVLQAKGETFAPMNANWSLLPNVPKEARLSFASSSLKRIESFRMRGDE